MKRGREADAPRRTSVAKKATEAYRNGDTTSEPDEATLDSPQADAREPFSHTLYDLARNAGWVGVGVDHDTAAFAVRTIDRWWQRMGMRSYPGAKRLLITADCGGSNGHKVRLWKWELQKLANRSGLEISVCHFPPGTSKWNKIEHRMFSFISKSWRARPLVSHKVILNSISSTRTEGGLVIQCELDRGKYPLKKAVPESDFAKINIRPESFHGEWNYTIRPQGKPK